MPDTDFPSLLTVARKIIMPWYLCNPHSSKHRRRR